MAWSTPCPAPRQHCPCDDALEDLPDDTADIEFTRAVQQEFKNSKPKRRQTLSNKTQYLAPVTIFEDVPEDAELVVDLGRRAERGTLLSRPAQKIPTTGVRKEHDLNRSSRALREVGQARKQPAIAPELARPDLQRPEMKPKATTRSVTAKDPRRRTIFVPEDTSIFSVHPGAQNTAHLFDTFQLPEYIPKADDEMVSQPKPESPARRQRQSLAIAPKRMPLQHVQPMQNLPPGIDVAGANTGKENVPPFAQLAICKKKVVLKDTAKSSSPGSRLHAPTAASQGRKSLVSRTAVPIPIPKRTQHLTHDLPAQTAKSANPPTIPAGVTSGPRVRSLQPRGIGGPKNCTPPRPRSESLVEKKQKLREFISAKRSDLQASKLQQYPVLAEDLAQPELYENGWLSYQEVALTEIVNEIFGIAQVEASHTSPSTASLREQMIDLYNQPQVAILHKRLQASLLYGALARSKEGSRHSTPNQDIGLRKRFQGLWLDNYDEVTLRTAVEVVVGRQVPRRSGGSADGIRGTESLLDPHAGRRALAGFLDTFFVSVADVEHQPASGLSDEVESARWRKMMLRSLMLVYLLDQAKERGAVSGCLFKTDSTKKASTAVLQALYTMLMPSIGDIVRTLKHMDYEVGHVQDPLDEVTYRIENIAIDLRDGILLTHLVEILLYASRTSTEQPDFDGATMTITLPDTTTLQSALYNAAEPVLSQHMKMPCLGHAQKVFNVQIALSALECHSVHSANVVGEIAAEDIVDGHREKTLSLLWSLVSVYGLNHLVDCDQVNADIQRNGGTASTITSNVSRAEQERLLLSWATAHAGHCQPSNLTTSFADGTVYGAIISSFAAFLPAQSEKRSSCGKQHNLISNLRALGCSMAFTNQLSSTVGVIPSKETTIANLAFLASRLLPLATKHHAATAIQRTWRLHRARVVLGRRVVLMRISHACAQVVQTRDRAIDAATVLQRAWRAVLDSRIEKLDRDVREFQAIARGLLVRKAVWREKKTRQHGGVGHEHRVMGGW